MTTHGPTPQRPKGFSLQARGGNGEVVAIPGARARGSLLFSKRGFAATQSFYRSAALNLLHGNRWSSRRVFVTSPAQGDGKTCTAFHMAGALASLGKPVLLVEINFVKPRFREVLGNPKLRCGLEGALRGAARPEDCVFHMEAGGLPIIAVRNATPLEGLRPILTHFHDFLDWSSERYEWVILDGPAVLSREWEAWFGEFAGQSLLVVREQKTPEVEVRSAALRLGSRLTGVLLNGAGQSEDSERSETERPDLLPDLSENEGDTEDLAAKVSSLG